MIQVAKDNARNAGVHDFIQFEIQPLQHFLAHKDMVGTMVSNPPYGLRLQDQELAPLYQDIAQLFQKNF